MIWKVLGIDKTKDKEVIRKAYLGKLHFVNPEDDEEGFKELRSAYEEALVFADQPEETEDDNADTNNIGYGRKKNDVDRWVDKVSNVYSDIALRRNEECWKSLLNDPICDDLDTEIEAGEKLLVFLMSHSYIPQTIWRLIDNRFHYSDNIAALKERFPENYIDFLAWQIKTPGFIDYELFDGDTKDHPDEFIYKLYEIKGAEEKRDIPEALKLLNEIERYDITHPFTDVERANCLLLQAGELDEFIYDSESKDKRKNEKTETETRENKTIGIGIDKTESESKTDKVDKDKNVKDNNELRKQALDIMEELDFEFSSNIYIHRIYGEALLANKKTEAAMQVFNELKEKEEGNSNFAAMLGRAKCMMLDGDYENAKEELEDILEEKVQDIDALTLLDVVNAFLVDRYINKLKTEKNMQTTIKLGWCYYQQREFKKGIELLDDFGESEEYDYINLRCRLYLADEDYVNAYPLAMKWLSMIESSVDDGTREMEKRKKRRSLALFSIGVCLWEIALAENDKADKDSAGKDDKATGDKNNKEETGYNGESDRKAEAVDYIEQSVEEEQNHLVKMSYMEQLAKFYLADRQYERCVAECSDIINMDAGFFPAYVHRQRANYELKKAKEVVDDYFECIEIYPEYAPPYVLAAEVFFAFEQYDDIEHILENAEEAHLDSDALELYRIRVLHYKEFSHDNLLKCLEMIERLEEKIKKKSSDEKNLTADIDKTDNVKEDDDSLFDDKQITDIEKPEEIVREHALIYWDLNENDQAISLIDKYVKEHPHCVMLQNLKIDILNQMGRNKEALQLCEKLYKETKSVYMQTRLGVCYERAEDYDNALKTYLEVYDRDPQYNAVVRRLMYLNSFLSDKEKSLEYSRDGIRYATEYIELTGSAEGYVERGNLYIDIYELEKAADDCRKAIELNPDMYYAYNNLGCALLKLRKTEEAIPPLLHAIEMDESRDHLPYLNLAEAYTILGKYDEAVEKYKQMLKVFPKHTYVWKDIVKLYCKMGKYDKAIAYYQKETETLRKRLNEGDLLSRIKNKDEKTRLEEKLMEQYCELGDVYRQAEKYVQANEYYEKVCKRMTRIIRPKFYVNAAFKLMEYYRDIGNPRRAYNLIFNLRVTHMNFSPEILGYDNGRRLLFIEATVEFEMGKRKLAKDSAERYFNLLSRHNKNIGKLLEDARYRPNNLYEVAIMKICEGELSEAKRYIEQIKDCHLCVMCECSDCFEYYFAKGLISELENRYDEAVTLYEKAIELKGDYPCAQRHLELSKQKLKG